MSLTQIILLRHLQGPQRDVDKAAEILVNRFYDIYDAVNNHFLATNNQITGTVSKYITQTSLAASRPCSWWQQPLWNVCTAVAGCLAQGSLLLFSGRGGLGVRGFVLAGVLQGLLGPLDVPLDVCAGGRSVDPHTWYWTLLWRNLKYTSMSSPVCCQSWQPVCIVLHHVFFLPHNL